MHNSFKLLYNENFNLTDHPEILSRIQQNQQQSIQAFSYYAPELVKLVKQHDQLFDVFFNHNQQLNICDTLSQLALYSAEPTIEVETEIAQFIQSAPFISFLQPAGSDTDIEEIDVLLLFGVGLGLHLPALLRRVKVKYLLIYESSSSMLRCSTFALNWQEFLNEATAVGTAVSIQIAKPGSEILDNLRELSSFIPCLDKVYLYRHICDPIYDEVINYLLEASGRPELLTKSGVQFLGYQAESDAVQLRAGSTLLHLAPALVNDKNEIFQQNLAALATHYPGLEEVFNSYQPQRWLPVYDSSGQLNLYHKLRKCFLFRDREQEVASIVEQFKTQGQTGLSLLGQAVPWKLRHYLHFQTLKKLRDIEAKYKDLPIVEQQQVSNLVVLGCVALLSSEFISTSKPDNLVIFEREPDYFYASLFLVDWLSILQNFSATEKSLSLNIGLHDNYSVAFFRLMQGAHATNIESTAFLQLSFSDAYSNELTELKSDIRSSQAVVDYFDHAWYGINHSLLNIKAGAKFLIRSEQPSTGLDLPVFLVGNGPSLDELIPYIRQYQDRAIIVSCGTALSALMAYDIVPDFHAEAEQNRSTFPLVSKVKNHTKLKEINLISFSAVHPDTAALFKQVYLAFKKAEAATCYLNTSERLEEHHRYAELEYAYPTVTNLAFSFLTTVGFNNIYLFGIDFGLAEPGKHHSMKSVYFKEDGSEVYPVERNSKYNKIIQGNFKEYVNTKAEFDMARRTLEIAINQKRKLAVYNCSNGAKIKGTIPLFPDNVLIGNYPDKGELISEVFYANFKRPEFSILFDLVVSEADLQQIVSWSESLKIPLADKEDMQAAVKEKIKIARESIFSENLILNLLYQNSFIYFFSLIDRVFYKEFGSNMEAYEILTAMLEHIRVFVEETVVFIRSDSKMCGSGSFIY